MSFGIGICGDGQLDPRMRSSASQELIRRLCEGPVPIGDIEPELLDVFRKMRAVRIDGSGVYGMVGLPAVCLESMGPGGEPDADKH